MRHRKVTSGKLGRSPAHRKALMRNLATALFEFESIITTKAKAKALKRYSEKIITLTKRGGSHAHRLVFKEIKRKDIVKKLFQTLKSRFEERPGGYTRIYHLYPRKGDNAELVKIELLGEEEIMATTKKTRSKKKTKKKTAPKPSAAKKKAKDTKTTTKTKQTEISQEGKVQDTSKDKSKTRPARKSPQIKTSKSAKKKTHKPALPKTKMDSKPAADKPKTDKSKKSVSPSAKDKKNKKPVDEDKSKG